MLDIVWIGYIAAFGTTCSFVPQVLHILKTRDTRSISLTMYCMFVTGVFLWLVYGIAVQDSPVIVANAITLLLSSIILGMKIKDMIRAKRTASVSFT